MGGDSQDCVGHDFGVGVFHLAQRNGLVHVVHGVAYGDLLASADQMGESVVGAGELKQRVHITVALRPFQRRPDPQFDAADRVRHGADGVVLGGAQAALCRAQDLAEQLVFGREIPVEHALAHTETPHDLVNRGGVVTVGGKAGGGERDDLLPPLGSPRRQLPVHAGAS